MKTIGFIVLIAIKQRRGKGTRQGRGKEQSMLVNRVQHLILQGGVQGAAGVYLLIVLNLRTLCAGGDASIHPFGLFRVRENGRRPVAITRRECGTSYKFSKSGACAPHLNQKCILAVSKKVLGSPG